MAFRGKEAKAQETAPAPAEAEFFPVTPEEDNSSDEIPFPPENVGGSLPGRDGVPEAGMAAAPGAIPAELYDSVDTKAPEHMPARAFHFRLDKFSGLHQGPKAAFYKTTWRCQEEPYTGHPVYVNIMWCTQETIDKAVAGDLEALKNVKTNMREGKKIMQQAQWKKNNNLGEFLESHPEMRLRLRIVSRREIVEINADGTERWGPSGKFGNDVAEFLPLT